jgi:putative nucleotidyltransferase with HDIG domain
MKIKKESLHLLILEDNPADAELAVRELGKEGFVVEWSLVETEEAFREALNQRPEVILADYSLPAFDGLSALKIKQEIVPEIPLILISGKIGEELAVECIKLGATDYVLKDKLFRLCPVVRRALEEAQVYRERKEAEEKLRQSYKKLRKMLNDIVRTVALTVEIRDPYTAGHQQRVSQLTSAIARQMNLPSDQVEGIYMAAILHDIGKISVPAEILTKPSRLTEIEMNLLRAHSEVGNNILKRIDFPWPLAKVVLQHHERRDGFGYPKGLKGDEILMEARILGVADVVEAMSSHRPYRPAFGIDKALEEISQNREILYDPEVVDACLRLFKEKEFKFES